MSKIPAERLKVVEDRRTDEKYDITALTMCKSNDSKKNRCICVHPVDRP